MSSPSQYTSLAAVYDKLNNNISYTQWADYIESQFDAFANKKRVLSILDLACGTGAMTIELAKRGYDMTGIDLSEDMLAVARKKCDNERFRHNVLLTAQNMTNFELYGTVDATICCLDSLNYLTSVTALENAFRNVYTFLEPDGLFIFDMNTPYKFENVYGVNSYIPEADGVLCAWQNYYNRKTKLCDFYLSIFTENNDGTWTRHEETQRERCFSLKTVKSLLSKIGFELCSLYGDLNGEDVTFDTERWHFTARAKK